jgi:glycosyltransferase involved in cell wall biosynthesis
LEKEKMLKTAVVIEALVNKGGSERAALVLANAFNADIWTTSYHPSNLYDGYRTINVKIDPLYFMNQNDSHHSRFIHLILEAFSKTESISKIKHMKLKDYDLVFSIGIGGKQACLFPGQKRIHYELYEKVKYKYEWLCKPWFLYMDKIDKELTDKIHALVCNSESMKSIISAYYHRAAQVIYPAVNIHMFKTGISEDYFLSVQRISPDKQIETQIEAFRIISNKKLLVAGNVNEKQKAYFQELKRIAPSNVVFTGPITDQELVNLYSHCLAAIQTNPQEPLGRIPIEAMASGKPCIAVNSGGFKETIVNGVTGVLVNMPYAENMAKAITDFNKSDYNPSDCLKRAQFFSEEMHITKMRKLVASL